MEVRVKAFLKSHVVSGGADESDRDLFSEIRFFVFKATRPPIGSVAIFL
jgi:hypothetical protein